MENLNENNSQMVDAILKENKTDSQKKKMAQHDKAADELLREMGEFEKDRVEISKQSAKRAWIIASVAISFAVLSIVALIIALPLKSVDYRLLTVNSKTGLTEIVQPLADAKKETYGEALDKFWIGRYITERGSYQWETIQNSYNFIKLTSSSDVFAGYNTYIRASNSPVEMLSDNKKVKLTDLAIAFLPSKHEILAQVSFVKTILNRDDTESEEYLPTRWNATITFDYKKDITTQSERLINPLGFEVTSYREDRVIE